MGVVNVTPDSFSDGGQYYKPKAAIQHGLRLVAEGANMLDIGGQSTRPGAVPVDEKEEGLRVMSVIKALARKTKVPISIDTTSSHSGRAMRLFGRGKPSIINDITALVNKATVEIAARTGCCVCLTHMQGTPQTMQIDPRYDDVVKEVFDWLAARRDALVEAGIERERIVLDPGIGFGKTAEHNLAILNHLERFRELGQPLLVGLSRKAFIGKVLGDQDLDRTAGTIGGGAWRRRGKGRRSFASTTLPPCDRRCACSTPAVECRSLLPEGTIVYSATRKAETFEPGRAQ